MEGSSWTQRLDWVSRHIPYTQRALAGFPERREVELFICFHIDLKMIPVILSLSQRLGLRVVACNKSTVDPAGWQYLRDHGVSLMEYDQAQSALSVAVASPRYLCDLGGDLICQGLNHSGSALAALEGTTSGIRRIQRHLAGRAPGFPIIDWNSAPLKLSVHNEKMVGFSLWQTFTELTRLSLHGKTVGVLGFGAVGRGIARTARHLGGTVSVFDPSPAARTLASFEGFAVPERLTLLQQCEVVVTATGQPDALLGEDLQALRNGAFLLNAGHGSDELSAAIREHPGRFTVLPHVEELRYGPGLGRHCFLLARGELVNLGAGFGDTINGFDLTSAQLVRAIAYLLESGAHLSPDWHVLPADFMDDVLS